LKPLSRWERWRKPTTTLNARFAQAADQNRTFKFSAFDNPSHEPLLTSTGAPTGRPPAKNQPSLITYRTIITKSERQLK
jgi:hypothetical protein